MKRICLILLAACLTTAAFANLRSEIVATNAKIAKAMRNKDAAAFKKVVQPGITKDFKYVENGQTLTFDEMFEQMKASWTMTHKVTEVMTKVVSVKEKGATGVAVLQHKMSGIMKGQDGKTHKFSFMGTSTDTYRKEGGKWKMSSMTWGKQSMTMDGKPFDPSKASG